MVDLEDYKRLVKEHQTYKQRLFKLEEENRNLRKENTITIKKTEIRTVEPPGYKQDMARLREMEKRNKELEKIIEYGNISTVSSIINEFKNSSAIQLERLSRELQFYSVCEEEYEDLLEFINYIEKVEKELKNFLFLQKDGD